MFVASWFISLFWFANRTSLTRCLAEIHVTVCVCVCVCVWKAYRDEFKPDNGILSFLNILLFFKADIIIQYMIYLPVCL
jgi:hypothetical protein